MTAITYRRVPVAWGLPITVKNELGRDTLFSDHLAYSAFVHGLLALRAQHLEVTLIDEDGTVLVGDFSDPANRVEVN